MHFERPPELFSIDEDPDVIRARDQLLQAKQRRKTASKSYRVRRRIEHSEAVHELLKAESAATTRLERAGMEPQTPNETTAKSAINREPAPKPIMTRECGDDTNYPRRERR